MTNRERRALAQDYPKDFISDKEWDFIESLATCKGDGVKNKSNTACRMPKSGGEKTMAKNGNKQYTNEDKKDYYAKRVNDKSLSDSQRNFAAKRLTSLTSGKPNASRGNQNQTGRRYNNGMAQSFTVTVKPCNKQ